MKPIIQDPVKHACSWFLQLNKGLANWISQVLELESWWCVIWEKVKYAIFENELWWNWEKLIWGFCLFLMVICFYDVKDEWFGRNLEEPFLGGGEVLSWAMYPWLESLFIGTSAAYELLEVTSRPVVRMEVLWIQLRWLKQFFGFCFLFNSVIYVDCVLNVCYKIVSYLYIFKRLSS